MPNHISNIMDVTGPADELERFRKKVCGENPDLVAYYKDKRAFEILRARRKSEEGQHVWSDPQKAEGEIEIEALDFNGTVRMPIEVAVTTSGTRTPDNREVTRLTPTPKRCLP